MLEKIISVVIGVLFAILIYFITFVILSYCLQTDATVISSMSGAISILSVLIVYVFAFRR